MSRLTTEEANLLKEYADALEAYSSSLASHGYVHDPAAHDAAFERLDRASSAIHEAFGSEGVLHLMRKESGLPHEEPPT